MARHYYFALTRLLTTRQEEYSELSAVEAYFGSTVIFIVTYTFLIAPLACQFSLGRLVLACAVMPFAAWLLWLVMFYLNALLRRLAIAFDILPTMRARDFQHIMICVWMTIFALSLLGSDGAPCWIGRAWLLLLAGEILATLMLKFLNGSQRTTT